MRVLASLALLLALGAAALAVQPGEVLKDPALEGRARTLSQQLRCMVCQNQSIDDSDAPLARDLRLLVRERLAAGDNDRQVVDFIVSRYGEFVLLKPPVNAHTLLLWLTPAFILLAGVGGLVFALRRRAGPQAESTLTSDEQRRLHDLGG